MGTNPGTASYSKRQAKRAGGGAGGGAGAGAGAGGGAGTASPFSQTDANAARTLVQQVTNSGRMGLRLRDVTPQEVRQEVMGFSNPKLNTRLMNMEARARTMNGLIDNVNDLSQKPLPADVAARLDASRRTAQLSMIGYNRQINGIQREIANRGDGIQR